MLKNIIIKNLALIEEADIEPEAGLNILTGETGAGKSIIISSVNMALGKKADKTMIRNGSKEAYIELLFTGVGDVVEAKLSEHDIEAEDGNLIISRKLSDDSSISKVNGKNVTLSILKEITGLLIDIHGQHDHQSLLDPAKHIDLVDDFGGSEIAEIKTALKDEHNAYRKLRIEYKSYDKTEDELEHETALSRFELNEIETADFKEGEDEALEAEFKNLSDNKYISQLLNASREQFGKEGEGILDMLQAAIRNIDEAYNINKGLEGIRNSIIDVEDIAKGLYKDISVYCEQNSYDAERIFEISTRLDEINKLKSKYGQSYEKIEAYRKELAEKLDAHEGYFEKKRQLEEAIHASAERLNELSAALSAKRKETVAVLEPEITENLKDLNFLQSGFKISMEKNDRIGENGFDKIEFLISLNPGEAYLPLAKIASGGELSRIMLAIKSAVAKKDRTATLIFDEIDSGISGKTAHMVAEKLHDLSLSHQIICISHLPQIAAMADTHFHIQKEIEGENTISGIHKLDDDQMIKEIAGLLGGASISHAAIENARDLKGNANFYKHKLK